MIKNKKGDEKIMSIWWFFVIVIIAGGVVAGVLAYYGADIDVSEIEARVLSDRVSSCLTNGPYLNENVFSQDFDFFDSCKISKSLFQEDSDYYIRIRIISVDGNIVNKELNYGQRAFEKTCEINRAVVQEDSAKCSFTSQKLISADKEVLLEVVSASDQKGRKNNLI